MSIVENAPDLLLRNATISDSGYIHDIAKETGLDINSRYIYSLWCHDFNQYTAVATHGDIVAGFVMCYPRPESTDHLFIWQAGILPEYRGYGLAGALLHHVYSRRFSHVECTVTPSNSSSLQFLQKFADDVRAPLVVSSLFDEAALGGHGHEREDLVTIGPIHQLFDASDTSTVESGATI